MNLATLRTLLIDGDGVLWRGDKALPGLQRFYDVLRSRGIHWALLTNNNTRTVDQYLEKLAGLGIQAEASQIYSSSTATASARWWSPAGPPRGRPPTGRTRSPWRSGTRRSRTAWRACPAGSRC